MWVALFGDPGVQAWYAVEEVLLTLVAGGHGALAPGLFGNANAIPPWGTRPSTMELGRGRRLLEGALPLTAAMFRSKDGQASLPDAVGAAP